MQATVELFTTLVDEVLRLEGSGVLFMSLATDKTLIQGLVKDLDAPHDFQRHAVISILHALVIRAYALLECPSIGLCCIPIK